MTIPKKNQTLSEPTESDSADRDQDYEELAAVISDLTDRQLRGESVAIDDVCREYPEWSEELRRLWATVMVTQAASEQRREEEAASGPPPPLFELPYQFGDYWLEEEIGRGGMGVVFRATQLSLNREVALKMILKGEFANEEDRRRFRSEAQAAARLTHPNIVSITEVGEQSGYDYFCMEFIRGGTLADQLSKGPLPPREAAELASQVARAIGRAHRQGILHRDLKPSNILIGTSGTPYIADFGLAKWHPHTLHESKTHRVLGTPTYMAPEQVAQARGDVGPTSDVYSLGTMLYHMLTGRPPFQAASPVDVMLMVLDEDPLPPRVLNRKVDRDLEMIVMRCLQKPQDLRYQSANELADDLQAYLKGEPIRARDGRFTHVIANLFRETPQASVLENWGVLWMWHSLILFIACLATNVLYWMQVQNRWSYWFLWSVGFGAWALVFWWLRRRKGPVTVVERQIAHTWLAGMLTVIFMFPLEWLMGLEVLTLSPLLSMVAAMTFIVKAAILSGRFYISAAVLLTTAFVMAGIPDVALALFGAVVSGCFFFPGFKYYYRQRHER